MVKLTINGQTAEYEEGTKLLDVAKDYASSVEGDILICLYRDRLTELFQEVRADGEVKFLTAADTDGRRAYKRSMVFLMQRAIDAMYPDKVLDVRIEFPAGGGYYCMPPNDTEGGVIEVDDDFIRRLKEQMDVLVERDIPFKKFVMKTRKASDLFKEEGLQDKVKLLKYRSSSNINIYELDGVHDYFYGYMVPSTGVLKYYDIIKYDEGFILQFPQKGKTTISEFSVFPKLYTEMKTAAQWSDMMQIRTVGALNDAIAAGRGKDIILLQEALMEERIGAAAQEIIKDRQKKFIMVAGPSSSGKTTFAQRLSVQLRARGLTPHPIGLDNYYLNRDQMPLDEFGEKNFEALEALDIEQFNEDMVRLLNGERVEIPVFNFKIGKREYKDKFLQIGKDDVLIIEGIHGLNDKLSHSLPKESKFKIYISALTQLSIDEHNPLSTTDGRLIRRIVRDARTRATPAEGTIAMWGSVRRGEENYIFPFQEEADLMFNSALIYEMAVLKLYAEPLLYAIERDSSEYREAKRLKKLLTYFLPMPTEVIAQTSLIREFIGGSCYQV